jgi:uncharacterized protein YecA (UPF0149 family)
VLALFTMVGHEVPEMPQWRAQVADAEARQAERMKEMQKLFSGRTRLSEPRLDEPMEWDEDVPPWQAREQPTAQHAPAGEIAAPIRRTTPKVGRNDPCPCGSGKKYKKCCGK